MMSDTDPVILFRMAERLTLTAIVIVVAIVVMVGFWRSVQKLDVSGSGGLGIGGSMVLSTPVFVLLSIVGYAWVSLSNPIDLARPEAGSTDVAGAEAQPRFIGASGAAAITDGAYDRTVAQRRIRSLNCIAGDAGGLTPRQQDDLADTRLTLMAPVWADDWGDFDDFAAWARGQASGPPDTRARAFYEDRHVTC